MVKIEKRIVPLSRRRAIFSGTNRRRTLTVHQTGNTAKGANADMHAWLQQRGYARASWHIQSDDHRIIQSFPFNVQTWHAGDGRGNGNLHSISWEICINEDGNYLKSLKVAAKGIAKVLKDEGLTVADLRQHRDWSRKNCPAQIRASKDGVSWNDFKRMVQAEYDGKSTPTTKPTPGKSINTLAHEVIAGKHGAGADRRKSLGSRYEAVQAEVNRILSGSSKPKPKPKPKLKSNRTIAAEVLAGKWGNGNDRKRRLQKAGYNYNAIQKEVNRQAGSKPSPKKSASQVADEIYRGRGGWGNGAERTRKLRNAGYNPNEVQRLVNKKFR